ncbi:MAG: hypothetical protein JRI68_21185, partial [Deltaproteobacteria bacterium]|nr:hypothetical protein [Deltaproteobacteria bacterium]
RCLTGKLPFRGKNANDLGVNICTGRYVLPTEVAPDLPPGVDDFIRHALMVEPHERFATAQEMAEAYARITPESYATLAGPMSEGGYSGPGIVPSDPGQIMGPPTAPSWVTSASQTGVSYPGVSHPGPQSSSHALSDSAVITSAGSLPGAESQPALSGTFDPHDPLFAPQGGSLVTATVDDDVTMAKPPANRRKVIIGVVIGALLAVLLLIGTLVGGDDPGETQAEPTSTAAKTGQAPATGPATTTTETGAATRSVTDDQPTEDDTGDDEEDPPVDDPPKTAKGGKKDGKKGGSKGGKTGGSKPPPGGDYDPFKNRK